MNEARAVWRLPVLERLGIVAPQLAAVARVERNDAVVRRAHIEHVIDHQRRVLERAGLRAEFRQRAFVRLPRPRDLQRPRPSRD